MLADNLVRAALVEAVRFVRATPIILATTPMFMMVNVGEGVLAALSPVYAQTVLDAGRRPPLGRAIAVAELAAGCVYARLAGRRAPLGVEAGA